MTDQRRLPTLFLIVGAVLAGVVVAAVLRMGDKVTALEQGQQDLATAYESARKSVPEPAKLPTAKEIIDGIEVPSGPPGRDGRDGRDGRNATDQQVAAAVATWLGANPPPAGPPGRDGVDGQTPPCYFTAAQCQGQDGADGRDGVDGAPGADSTVPGPQGPPGPAVGSFQFEWANQTYTCTDPDGDGNYTCESEPKVP